MLHINSEMPLVIELQRSRQLLLYISTIHGLALLALCYPLKLPLFLQGALVIGVIVIFILSLYRFYSKTFPRYTRLIWETNGNWRLFGYDGREISASLNMQSYVSTWLCILNFKTENGQHCSTVILPDMLLPDTFRRLRVRLRQMRPAEASLDSSR